ncbi:hypothetical protein [Microbacterium sp. H83]|uniref:hypothetical protein n=1 Tax=Microbacterium sp. H83 TaxID=1827324 RepID=UPI0007F4DB2D|nr:hypothetical protein [Microbacterium sp. H83]OAN33066.1 hypothetical protein A4X16_07630 [Microbacterium sp. H83]
MSGPGGTVQEERRAAIRSVAAIVVVALAINGLLLAVLDLKDDDGAAPIIAMFGVPALASALVIQIIMSRLSERRRVPAPVLWLMLAVLPFGTLLGFVVAIAREPEYFIGEESPWMLVWVPILICVGVMLGAVVWFFLVFPLASLMRVIRLLSRGEAKPAALIMPLVLLTLGVVCVVGGLSVSTGEIGRRAETQIIAAFFGLPGTYDVIWEPGLWIVRAIVAVIVATFAVPALAARLRTRADAR